MTEATMLIRSLLARSMAVALALAAAVAPAAAGPAAPVAAAAVANPEHTLWYDEPATDWESRALPIGDGALGAMVFGGVGSEQLQFNEKTLWTGDRTYPLNQAPDAVRYIHDGHARGKVVIAV